MSHSFASQEKLDAIAAMENLKGWTLAPVHHFEIAFQFSDESNFFRNKVPYDSQIATDEISELKKDMKSVPLIEKLY